MTETGEPLLDQLDGEWEARASATDHHTVGITSRALIEAYPELRSLVLQYREERDQARDEFVKGLSYLESLLDAGRYDDARASVKGELRRRQHGERWARGECRVCHQMKQTLRGICAACVARGGTRSQEVPNG